MHKIPEVEDAKALMSEAVDWSVFKWLFEKQRVRKTADIANAVLDRANRAVKAQWTSDLKAAHKQLLSKSSSATNGIDHEIKAFLQNVQQSDEAAHRARMKAEATFDDAEREMSTELAREGCRQAIQSWKLHEKAIRAAEAVPAAKGTATVER